MALYTPPGHTAANPHFTTPGYVPPAHNAVHAPIAPLLGSHAKPLKWQRGAKRGNSYKSKT